MNLQAECKSMRGPVYVICPNCGKKMMDGKYICGLCMRYAGTKPKTPPLMTSEPEFIPMRNGAGAGCHSCGTERRIICHQRISEGGWLLCEIPDAMDYLRVGKLKPEEWYRTINA